MNRDYSLLDANLARAREGLRVLDEVARFSLRQAETFGLLKTLRHRLSEIDKKLGGANLVGSRAFGDIGEAEVVKSEYSRNTLYDIVRASSNRVAESLRVLEEFLKIYYPAGAKIAEDIRYRTYYLELSLLTQTPHFVFNKLATAGFVYPLSDDIEEIKYLILRGAQVVQLRDKKSDTKSLYHKTKELCEWVSEFNQTTSDKVLLFLNDRVDLAAKLPVAGVHIGQDYQSIPKARRLLGANKIIGVSNQTIEQLKNSLKDGADYVSIGPVFATPNKPERIAVGLSVVKEAATAAAAFGAALVAIGGIDRSKVAEVYATGATNIAVIRSAREFFD